MFPERSLNVLKEQPTVKCRRNNDNHTVGNQYCRPIKVEDKLVSANHVGERLQEGELAANHVAERLQEGELAANHVAERLEEGELAANHVGERLEEGE